MGVEEVRMPSPAAWVIPLSPGEVQRGHAVVGGLRAREERHHSWDACTQMRMLGELMELKDCVVKGFTLGLFFFESIERMLEARVTGQAALPRLPGRLGEERVDGEKAGLRLSASHLPG